MSADTKTPPAITEELSKERVSELQKAVGRMLRAANQHDIEPKAEVRAKLREQIARHYENARRLYDTYADMSDPKILPSDDADATWFIQRAEGRYHSVFGHPPNTAGAEEGEESSSDD
jgi:hypothetical protein